MTSHYDLRDGEGGKRLAEARPIGCELRWTGDAPSTDVSRRRERGGEWRDAGVSCFGTYSVRISDTFLGSLAIRSKAWCLCGSFLQLNKWLYSQMEKLMHTHTHTHPHTQRYRDTH